MGPFMSPGNKPFRSLITSSYVSMKLLVLVNQGRVRPSLDFLPLIQEVFKNPDSFMTEAELAHLFGSSVPLSVGEYSQPNSTTVSR